MSRFVKETLPLAAYGGGTGVMTMTLNNSLNLIHQAHTHFPVATMMVAPYEMAAGGAAVVVTMNFLKRQGAKFNGLPVATGLLLGVAFGAAVTAATSRLDAHLHNRVERSFEQIESPAPGPDR